MESFMTMTLPPVQKSLAVDKDESTFDPGG